MGTKLTTPVDQTFVVTFSVPVAGIGNITPGVIQSNPAIAGGSQIVVYPGEVWAVKDLYVTSAQTPDGLASLTKNGISQENGIDLNSELITNNSRPTPLKKNPVVLEGSDTVGIQLSQLAATAAAATVSAFLIVRRIPRA